MKNAGLFLVAYYTMRPKYQHITHKAGWMEDQDNISYDESINIVMRLKNKDITTAKVIIDLLNKTVVRNSWNSGASFDELFAYYREGYPQYLEPVAKQLKYDQEETTETENTDNGPETTEETVQTQEKTSG